MRLLEQERDQVQQAFRSAFRTTLPVMAGYLFLGFGFGMLFVKAGYSAGFALSLSGFVYAGAMQFVTIDLLQQGALLIEAAFITLLVNARHLFYGLVMAEKFNKTGKLKLYLAFSLTDETFALLSLNDPPEDVDSKSYYFCVSAINHLYWLSGTALGALAGSLIAIDLTGLEFSMTALFVTMLVEQWRNKQNRLSVVVGLCFSLVCLVIFGPRAFTMPAMIGICATLLLLRNKMPIKGKRV